MPETSTAGAKKTRRIRHADRSRQMLIYLGKQFRFFINQSDWKVLPMAGIIAALVSMVIKKSFFVNMEGSLIGAFALTCVAIWNGCFNSIQSVCRERAIIKREHRSGMHITSYVAAHMIYQLFLCTLQTVLSVYILKLAGVRFPEQGFFTKWMILDIGISMLLISYAADMMSLFLSSISHTTTGAMTLMPFILIFQLVFSGSVIPLPDWGKPLTQLTISNYGVNAIAAQSGYNELPMETVWKTVADMRENEIGGTFTVGDILEALDRSVVEKHRDLEVVQSFTVGEAAAILEALDMEELAEEASETQLNQPVTLGEIVDFVQNNEALQQQKDRTVTLKATVGDVIDFIGEERVKGYTERKTAEAAQKPEYERTTANVVLNWLMLCAFSAFFALLSTISLELIDKDKR